MFRIPGLPVSGGNRHVSRSIRRPSPFIDDTKSSLTNRWVNAHANSFQPIVREKRTPPADTTNDPVYVPAAPVVTTGDAVNIVKSATAATDTLADTSVVPTRNIVMSAAKATDTLPDEVETQQTANDDDDGGAAASDNEVNSIMAKRNERLVRRYERRREYKRQRSRSRMSNGRKTPARAVKRRRSSASEPLTMTVPKETKNILTNIIDYAKYPLCVSTNAISVYLVLSYVGVDVFRYTDLTGVSTSLLKHVKSAVAGGSVVADVFGRITPDTLVNTTQRFAAPLVATLALLK